MIQEQKFFTYRISLHAAAALGNKIQLRNKIQWYIVENKDKSNTKAKTRTKRGAPKRSKEMDSIVSKITEREPLNQSNDPNIIVPPDTQKADEYIVRPTYL